MLLDNIAANIVKLRAVTVERGATPAEAATAAVLARRLSSRIAEHIAAGSECDITVHPSLRAALAPGVHVKIV
jgi:hypothetical protein